LSLSYDGKTEVASLVQKYVTMAKYQFEKSVEIIPIDNGLEFK